MKCKNCGMDSQDGPFCQHCGQEQAAWSGPAQDSDSAEGAAVQETETKGEAGGTMSVKTRHAPAAAPALPEAMPLRWLVCAALAAGVAVDLFVLRYNRGVNILIAGAVLMALWLVPLARRRAGAPPVLPTALFGAMTVSMFWQNNGTVDNILYPLWLACLGYFGMACRARLLGLEGKALTPVTERMPLLRGETRRGYEQVLRDPDRRTWVGQVAAGLVVAGPLVFLILGLMQQADAAFDLSVRRLIGSLNTVPGHLFWILAVGGAVFAWAGLLALARERAQSPRATGLPGFPLVSSGVVLGSLAAVLSYFLAVHLSTVMLPYERVQPELGIEFWVYIRRGFAELLAVEAVVGGTLLALVHTRAWQEAGRGAYRWLAWLLIALTAGLSVSCAARLGHYVQYSGLTIVRSLNVVGVALSFACLGYLALRVARPQGLARSVGAVVVMFLVFFTAWSVAQPVRCIAWYNVSRDSSGGILDLEYLAHLGTDAMPALAWSLEQSRGARSLSRAMGSHYGLWIRRQEENLERRAWVEWNPGLAPGRKALRTIRNLEESHGL